MLRAAIIGCGAIGSEFADDPKLRGDVYSHAEAYVRCQKTELMAVCDIDAARAQRCARRWSVHAHYLDYRTLLAEQRPEVVSICTPDPTHAAILRDVLDCDSVRAVLCEKPLATDPKVVASLVHRARDRAMVLAVNHSRRYAESICNLRVLLASGEIGAVQAVTGWYSKGVLHNGSHWFDLLRMLAGEVEWVQAWDGLAQCGPDPTLDVLLMLRSGALATLRACPPGAFSLFEMDLLATCGRVRLTESTARITLFLPQPSERYSGYTELAPVERDFGGFRDLTLRAVEDLVAAVEERRAPACTGGDGLAAVRIAQAAIRSSSSGERVILFE